MDGAVKCMLLSDVRTFHGSCAPSGTCLLRDECPVSTKGRRATEMKAEATPRVSYDLAKDEIVVRYTDGREERLTPLKVRQMALWKDGRMHVEGVFGAREVPVE